MSTCVLQRVCQKLSDWGLTHRGLVLRRFDGILWDFADFFSESLNPNRLNPNHFAEFCGLFAEFCGLLRNFADLCGIVYGILRNFAESLNPNRLNPNRLTADSSEIRQSSRQGRSHHGGPRAVQTARLSIPHTHAVVAGVVIAKALF